VSSEAKAAIREGFGPGETRRPAGTDPGRFVPDDQPLTVEPPPPPSTTSTSTSTSTTSTTAKPKKGSG